jgi:hypothetical protein
MLGRYTTGPCTMLESNQALQFYDGWICTVKEPKSLFPFIFAVEHDGDWAVIMDLDLHM